MDVAVGSSKIGRIIYIMKEKKLMYNTWLAFFKATDSNFAEADNSKSS